MIAFWARAGLRAALMARRPFTPRPVQDGQVMDGGMAALAAMVGGGTLPHDIAALRDAYGKAPALVGLRPDRRVRVREEQAGGRPVRRYLPPGLRDDGSAGLLVYYHGGGFIMGSLDSHDALCRAVAARAGIEVAAVEYRLAPEHPFPAAPDDAVAAFRALRAGRSGRVAVGGDSAGGTLAAVVCQACRDAPPALQWLLYPFVDVAEDVYPSLDLFESQFPLTHDGLRLCERLYVPPGTDDADVRLSPLRGRLDGLPPALIVGAGFDPLRDHAAAYAAALRRAGVPVALRVESQLVHGFADFGGMVPAARRAVWRAIAVLRDAMTRPDPGTAFTHGTGFGAGGGR